MWDQAEDFDAALMEEMQQSWAVAPVRPYDIYHLHRMSDWKRLNTRAIEDETVPIVVCSEALV